jgi:pimeloyl-ACP methyl ester carboxylesterase
MTEPESRDRSAQKTRSADGRTLVYAEWGDLDGSPVFALHGTPGCRLSRHPNQELVRSTGAHVITYDRPGYGQSDRDPGRSVAGCAADVAAIADALGFDRFAVRGGSGGGPHALAVAALLGDRITRVACVVGCAPYDALGDAWFDGMDPLNVREFGWALEGERRLHEELVREDREVRERVAADPTSLLEMYNLPESDKAVMARPDQAAIVQEEVAELSRNGVWGCLLSSSRGDSISLPSTCRPPCGTAPTTSSFQPVTACGSDATCQTRRSASCAAVTWAIRNAVLSSSMGGCSKAAPGTDRESRERTLAGR